MKVAQIYSLAREELRKLGVEAPDTEAKFITSWVSNIPVGGEVLSKEVEIEGCAERLQEVLSRRRKREPLQLIFGKWDFYGRDFSLEPGVLVPRPETEVLVEVALMRLKQFGRERVTGLDVGSGAGVLCVTLLAEMENLDMLAVDTADKAVNTTEKNAKHHGVSSRLRVYRSDFRDFSITVPERLDFVVSNPPYLSKNEFLQAMPEVRKYEPEEALVGGETGLERIEDLILFSGDRLAPGGFLFFEFGYGQKRGVMERIARDGRFEECEIVPDLARIPRVIAARKVRGEQGEKR